MATAYLASSGSYSDYSVGPVFLDKELADQYLADGFCDEIEEREVVTERIVPGQLLILQWTSAHDSTKGRLPANDWGRTERVVAAEHPDCTHSVWTVAAGAYYGERVVVKVQGLDHDRVRKVYSEQVAMARVGLGELDSAGAE